MLVIEPTKGRLLTDWSQINWTAVERNVKRLQGRIFRAVGAGQFAKAKSLQKLLARSSSAKLLAIRKACQQNRGKHTPGVDGVVCKTPKDRLALFEQGLSFKGYRPKPVRRIFIPKKNGNGRRPLGIPTIKDRVMQTIVRFALEPEWESRFEANSYGFRPGRCTMDAICALHAALRCKGSSRWILDADINSCFDKIDQEMLLKKLPVFTQVIRRWLKAGTVTFDKWESTDSGTPQGSPISPLLMNVALDGMERLFGCENSQGNRVSASDKRGLNKGITLVRFADDLVVTAPTKERIETYILPKLKAFLKAHGLTLSKVKTRIVHLDERFDFLGFTFMRQGGRLLTKPSKKGIAAHLKQLKRYLRTHLGAPAVRVVKELNAIIRGWTNYYRHGTSKAIFNKVRHRLFQMLWRWANRRHRNKSRRWIRRRYFREDWAFHEKGAVLLRHDIVPVTRFTKVTGKASPMNPDEAEYWEKRRHKRRGRETHPEVDRELQRRQGYGCGLCGVAFEEDDLAEKHHIQPRSQGGSDDIDNLMLIHRWCHTAYHARRN